MYDKIHYKLKKKKIPVKKKKKKKPLPKGHICLECESQLCLLLSGLLSYLTTFRGSRLVFLSQRGLLPLHVTLSGDPVGCYRLCGQQPMHWTKTRHVALCLQHTGRKNHPVQSVTHVEIGKPWFRSRSPFLFSNFICRHLHYLFLTVKII